MELKGGRRSGTFSRRQRGAIRSVSPCPQPPRSWPRLLRLGTSIRPARAAPRLSTAPPTATNSISLAVTSASRDAIIDVVSVTNPITPTPGSAQTLQWNVSVGTNSTDLRGAGSTKPGVGAFDGMTWSLSASTLWSISAESIQPPNPPTLAKFVNADALDTSKGTLIRWRTAYEVQNLGFKYIGKISTESVFCSTGLSSPVRHCLPGLPRSSALGGRTSSGIQKPEVGSTVLAGGGRPGR